MQDPKPRTWTEEDVYWRDNHRSRPYFDPTVTYDDYGPAYAYGVDSFGRHTGKQWENVEGDLSRDWEQFKGKSSLTWERAKHAVKDAWDRMTG